MFANAVVDLDSLPRVEEAPLEPIDPRYPHTVLALAAAIEIPVLVVVGTVVLLVPPIPLAARLAILLAVLAFLSTVAWLVYRSASVIRYAVREHDVILRTGVFWRKETVQPIKRIQHVEQVQGPLDKRLGLTTLRLYSAGTGNVTFRIPGLDAETAARIAAFILGYQDRADGADDAAPAHATAPERPADE